MEMNKHLMKVREALVDLVENKETYQVQLKELDEKNRQGAIAPNDYRVKRDFLRREMDVLHKEYVEELTAIREAYAKEVQNWATLNEKDLTEDAQVLSLNFPFKAEDYQKLEAKYIGNYTMSRLIHEHAARHEVTFIKKSYIDESEKIQEFDSVVNVARDAGQSTMQGNSSYIANLWAYKDKFEEAYKGVNEVVSL